MAFKVFNFIAIVVIMVVSVAAHEGHNHGPMAAPMDPGSAIVNSFPSAIAGLVALFFSFLIIRERIWECITRAIFEWFVCFNCVLCTHRVILPRYLFSFDFSVCCFIHFDSMCFFIIVVKYIDSNKQKCFEVIIIQLFVVMA